VSGFWLACELASSYAREAEADIAEAAIWYERRCAGLGAEFVRSVDACFALISRQPEVFPHSLSSSSPGAPAKISILSDLSRFPGFYFCRRRRAWTTSSTPLEIENHGINANFAAKENRRYTIFNETRGVRAIRRLTQISIIPMDDLCSAISLP
jgi:hypothetical protein